MEDKRFDSIEHEIIYNKLLKYLEENQQSHSNLNSVILNNNQNNNSNIENAENIEKMKKYKDVFAHRIIKSHRKKYIAKAIIFGKKVIRRCLKWYINPITEQQTVFNNATVEALENQLHKINNIEIENKNLLVKINELENQLSRIDKLENELSRIHKLEKQLDRIDELENQLNRIDELENQLNRIDELENQLSRIDKLENEINRASELESQLIRVNKLENQVEKINDIFKLELCTKNSFFEKKSYSQAGEDTILSYIFFVLGIKNEEITYLDLGANHAKELSNTYYFYENGGKGVLVEANPKLIQELSFYRHNDIILNSLVSEKDDEELEFYILSGDGLSTPDKEQALEACKINPNISIESVIKVKSITVNNIIEKYFGNTAPKFISIDIEGHDLEVIKSLDLDNYRPLVIVVETIEYRPYLPINVKKYEVIDYLKTNDYVEYAFTGINSIFIDAKYMRDLGQEG